MEEYRQRESLSFEKVSKKKKRSRYLKLSLENPLLSAFLVALCILVIVWCIGLDTGTQTGIISKADIGTIATHDYKAPRDFTFDRVDYEATERVRKQRVAEVLPIFRWDRTYLDSTLSHVRSAFEYMSVGLDIEKKRLESTRISKDIPGRRVLSDAQRQNMVETILAPFANEKVFDDYLSTRHLTQSEIDAGLDAWAAAHREDFVQRIGYVVNDSIYGWFSEQRFSKTLEDGITQVLDVVLGRMIVSTRQEVDNVGDLSVQWNDGLERHQKTIEKTEKSSISTLEESEALTVTLLQEKFESAPQTVLTYFKQFIRPNVAYDDAATERERQSVRDKTAELRVIEEYKKGQTIVARGNPIKQSHYEVFEKIVQGQGDTENRAVHWIALCMVAAVLIFMLGRSFLSLTGRRQKNRDIVYFATCIVTYALCLRGVVLLNNVLDSVYQWSYSILLIFPFAYGPMLMRIITNREYAYLNAVVSVILTSLIVDDNSLVVAYAMICTISGCLLTERPKRSNMIIHNGILLGIISAISALALYMFKGSNMTNSDYILVTILGALGGMISSGIVMIGLPLAESFFGYVTSNKLLELSNLEHPALKALFMDAPGTYQHSIMVGTLNEAAADAIGANSILARVGGYYHDIGKVKNAQYFAENQRGDNPHNRLNPNMSALILKAHERDGLEIAKKYKLPQDIRDFIATHHGTSRIEYFYQRAKEQQERVREEDYRYPGPRPQTRETGICMVSDMVEAAVRSLPDKSPDKILVLVRKLINHKFADGQFDECDLTLHDLNDIGNAIIGILNAFYHHRPEYPDQKKEREKLEAEKREKPENNDCKSQTSLQNADVANQDGKKQKSEEMNEKTDADTKNDERQKTSSDDDTPSKIEETTHAVQDKTSSKSASAAAEKSNQTTPTNTEKEETDGDAVAADEMHSDAADEENVSKEADELLKNREENDASPNANDDQQLSDSAIQEAYDLTFSSHVDVFKTKV